MPETLAGAPRSMPVNPIDRRRGRDRRASSHLPPDVVKPNFVALVFGAMEDCGLKQDAAAAFMAIDPATLSRIKTGSETGDPRAPKLPVHLLDRLPLEWHLAFEQRLDVALGRDQAPDVQKRVLDIAAFALGLAGKVV